ncbi:MAG: hypothetical protein ACXADS_12625 [Candidatus Thorarchaeota archaeon]|jgi:hypothetical protein
MPYKIVRFYRDADKPKRTIKKGLTKAEAHAHCKDKRTERIEGKSTDYFDAWEKYEPKKKRRRRR